MSSPLIKVTALAELLISGEVTVLDIRYAGPGSASGYGDFLAGHIPGACFVDLDKSLADSPASPGGRHPLPQTQVFAQAMRRAGVRTGQPVVVYDDWSSIAAARAWWLLRYHGHQQVYVLDGGWRAWRDSGLDVATGESHVQPGDFEPGEPLVEAINANQAQALAKTGVLLDARPANRFRGEDENVDPVAGHIPGARSLPALDLVAADGTLLKVEQLRASFAAVGASGCDIGVYCGSGIQASQVALAATVAGLPTPKLYPGSWSDWITDPARPIATG